MEKKVDEFFKRALAADNLGLKTPDISLVNEAREKIKARRKQHLKKESFFDFVFNFFHFKLKPYQAGIAALCIAISVFYFVNRESEKTENALVSQNSAANYSISSSTVLASLTQYTNNKTATSSSTVLTSIITFVVRN